MADGAARGQPVPAVAPGTAAPNLPPAGARPPVVPPVAGWGSAVPRPAAAFESACRATAGSNRVVRPRSRSCLPRDDSRGRRAARPPRRRQPGNCKGRVCRPSSAPLPATGRLSPASPSQVGQAVTVDGATTVAPRGPRGGFDISRQGTRWLAHRDHADHAPGRQPAVHRLPADRRRPNAGRPPASMPMAAGWSGVRDFEQRSIGNGVDFVTRQDGRREAYAARRAAGLPGPLHHLHATLRRTAPNDRAHALRAMVAGAVRSYETRPVVRYYDAGFFYGAPVAYYRPRPLPPPILPSMFVPFAVPVPAVAFGMVDEWVAFASTPRAYTDPAVLMGDMQIWSGFEEGRAYSAPWSGTLSVWLAAGGFGAKCHGSDAAAGGQPVQGSPVIPQQLGRLDLGAPPGYEGPPGPGAPVAVSEEVRLRVREQVRSTVALAAGGHAADIGRGAGGARCRRLPVPDRAAPGGHRTVRRWRMLPEHRRSDRF